MTQNALLREDFGKKRVYILVTKNTTEIYKEHETVTEKLTCAVLPLNHVNLSHIGQEHLSNVIF